jgi:hypothetical protein
MKKGFSIFLSTIMLLAVFHFSVATHYCGGTEVASKVSLTGKLADCGMENPNPVVPISGTSLNRHCCENYIHYCGIYANYVTTFSFVPETYQNISNVFLVPLKYSNDFRSDLILLHTDTSPPGTFRSTDVDLSGICVFRI